MATEEGVVLTLKSAKTALVKTHRSSACEACSSKDSCNTAGGGQEMEVEVINASGAKPGDTVIVEFESAPLLKATFLIYIFPILCLAAGAVIGQKFAPDFHMEPSAASASLGFFFFFLAFGLIRIISKKMAAKDAYQPKIIRIKKRALSAKK